jgi:hypothetical protein
VFVLFFFGYLFWAIFLTSISLMYVTMASLALHWNVHAFQAGITVILAANSANWSGFIYKLFGFKGVAPSIQKRITACNPQILKSHHVVTLKWYEACFVYTEVLFGYFLG